MIENEFAARIAILKFVPDGRHDWFFRYRRQKGERYELVEVQFDKHGRPKFTLNFGVVGKEGIIDAYGRFIDSKSARVAHLVEHGRLHKWPYSIFWFGLISPLGYRDVEASARKQIMLLGKLFAQVERWFATGQVGPNLRIYRSQENLPRQRRVWMQQSGKWPPPNWTAEDEEAAKKADAMSRIEKRES